MTENNSIDTLQEALSGRSKDEAIQCIIKYVIRGFEFFNLHGDGLLAANLRLKITGDKDINTYIDFMGYAIHLKNMVEASGIKWVTEQFICSYGRTMELWKYTEMLYNTGDKWKVHGKVVFDKRI